MIVSKHWTVFKGTDTRSLGMYQERAPAQVIPTRRVETLEIPGRSGNLEYWDGAYNTYQRTAEYIIRDLSQIDRIRALLTGSGWLTFDDEPGRKSWASINNPTEAAQFILEYRRAPVIFDIQPYKYETHPQELTYHLSQGHALETYLHNPGTVAAAPLIKITGNTFVTITAGGSSFRARIGSGIVVDCELQECYHPTLGGNLNQDMTGEFISLPPGECPLTLEPEGTATVTIQPRWRWL